MEYFCNIGKDQVRQAGLVLFFMHLLTVGLLAGIFCGKGGKYKRLEADYDILHQENIYLKKSRHEIMQQQRRLRSARHEMENDYVLEMAYLERKLYRQLEEHYRKKMKYIKGKATLIHTGSVGLDAILNHKLETAVKNKIHIDIQHQLSSHVTIDNHDLNILLGNLLDNAMEAVRDLDEEKRGITLTIKTNATTLFLETNNQYQGTRRKNKQGNYLTQKVDQYFHGIGLLNVYHIAHKYNGDVAICDEGNQFNVKVLLYMR